jgi:hypothetical protein
MLPAEGEEKQLEILKKLPGEKRMKIALDLSHLVKKVSEDGIRHQFPHISPLDLAKQLSLRTKE